MRDFLFRIRGSRTYRRACLLPTAWALTWALSGCETCPDGEWADAAGNCMPWSTCARGEEETQPGSASSDRVCTPASPWIRQFGNVTSVSPRGISLLEGGGVAVATQEFDSFLNRTAVARSFDRDGNLVSVEQMAMNGDQIDTVETDTAGRLFIAGRPPGTNQTQFLGRAAGGSWVWKKDAPSRYAQDLCVDPSTGTLFVTGYTWTGLRGFARAYDSRGNQLWERLASELDSSMDACTFDSEGNLYVTGYAVDPATNVWKILLMQLAPDGSVLLERTFGSSIDAWGTAISVNDSDRIAIVVGTNVNGPGALILDGTGPLLSTLPMESYGIQPNAVSWSGPNGSSVAYFAGYKEDGAGSSGGDSVVLAYDWGATTPRFQWLRIRDVGESLLTITDDGNGIVYAAGFTSGNYPESPTTGTGVVMKWVDD